MKKIFVYILLVFSFSACIKSVLDKRDLTGLGPEMWNNESTATLYLNRCYAVIMPAWPANAGTTLLPYAMHNTSDESNTNGNLNILRGTLAVDGITDFGASPTSNTSTYANIRRVNILLAEIDKGTLSEEIRTRIKSQAYFLRAWNYFQMVKLYGGVPYITYSQDWVNEDLYVSRNKTSECIDSLVRDLDSAAKAPAELIANQTTGNRGRLTRGAAMGLKGRILLTWASAQFNPTNIAARWERAYQANKAAYDELINEGHQLYPDFTKILTDESSANKEVIIIRSYDGVNASNSFENQARASSAGGGGSHQPTWNLVQAFPMKNGKPITDGTSGYDPVYYWKDRDPRFDATIVYNGSVWPLSLIANRKQWMYTGTNSEPTLSGTGFYCRKGVNTNTLKANAANGTTDWIEMRLAEVMLNLAECASQTNRMPEAYDLLRAIRKRAGITEGTTNKFGVPDGMTPEQMLLALINERRIEFAFEGKRYDDLRRTKLYTTLNGTVRTRLNIVPKAPYTAAMLNAQVRPGILMRDTIDINGADYTKYFTVTVTNFDAAANQIQFPDNYYFYAIPTTHRSRNPNLAQTNGWPGGTFDPLQ